MCLTRFIGLMSGTSLDGVDAVLLSFDPSGSPHLETSYFLPFPASLRDGLLALNAQSAGEIERSQLLANRLARLYAEAVKSLLHNANQGSDTISAIGCHGQTIRHRPELGFSLQIGNAALLAELTGISVICDFRSRDIAAGGQGAPLVPAFHHAVFSNPETHRVIVNIGGISNLTSLPPHDLIQGFDCGPGNVLMDGWIHRHKHVTYDQDGYWASTGSVIPELLDRLLAHPFLSSPLPKSTGRDTFHLGWLDSQLGPEDDPADVQATLLEFSARSIADAIERDCQHSTNIYLCGGGARNKALHTRISTLLSPRPVDLTDVLGIPVDQVEAAAFGWLARQTLLNLPGNLPSVTGASGFRILGAIYPA